MNQKAGMHALHARRFADVALPHLDTAYNYARFVMQDEADAQDAVQECYLLALGEFEEFEGGSVRAWLLAVLRRVCQAHLARRARLEPMADILGIGGARADDGAAVRRLVAALPAPLREAIVLREVHQFSYQEISRVSGVPVGTVMMRLARARERLGACCGDRAMARQRPGAGRATDRNHLVLHLSDCA